MRCSTRSPIPTQWERGLFILTYDEWGGFFDHVKPPILADDRASRRPRERASGSPASACPTVLASPYARRNYVDHRVYDHTSTLRFLEWRFLGAPPEGPGGDSDWNLTTARPPRQQHRSPSLGGDPPDPDLGFDLDDVDDRALQPGLPARRAHRRVPPLPEGEHPDPFVVSSEFREAARPRSTRRRTHTPWLDVPPAEATLEAVSPASDLLW